MIKLLKIVYISCCFLGYHLLAAEYNVITISRDTTSDYNKLSHEEIYLVFTQLARYFSEVDISKGSWSAQAKDILGKPVARIENPAIPTIIVFNEAFFGQDRPLSKEEVDEIVEIYQAFQHYTPNTYLYINFLYTDSYTEENEKIYGPQIEISKKRYTEIAKNEGDKILATFMQPTFIFDGRIQQCIDDENFETEVYIGTEKAYLENAKVKTMKFGQRLLFNQTKIFHEGEEIGYYNKSSFYKEIPDFLGTTKNLYYVIGNFKTNYFTKEPPIPVSCLICYDVDVVTKDQMPKEDICVFASNTSASLPLTLNNFNEPGTKLSNFYICADPKSETESRNISGILSNVKNSFEYSAEKPFAEEKHIFYLKSFLLTNNLVIEKVKL